MTPFDVVYTWPNKRGKSSIADADCDFLRDLCLQYKPTKILEIGTGSGRSTWAMALSSDCEIHTIDRDNWYSEALHSDRIHRYTMYSTKWFDTNDITGFDFVFIDAFLPLYDNLKLLKRMASRSSIVVHDYNPLDINSSNPEKGYLNIRSLLNYINSGDPFYAFDYNLTLGGECCAHLRLER